jgi:hypothetical protein
MESINLNGISFRWSDDQLVVTTARGQDILSAANAAQLLDFLQLHQQEMYAGEQGRELPPWARDERRYVSGTIEHQSLRLEERVPHSFLQREIQAVRGPGFPCRNHHCAILSHRSLLTVC